MWEIYHLNDRRIVLETFFYKIRTNVKMHNKLQGENLLKKILALFFAKTVLYTSLVYQKVRKAGKVWNFWDSREHDCNKSQKVDNNNTIIKSGGCKIRLYILTNIGALFSEFLQTILMNAYFLGKDTSAYSRGINKFIELI